MRRDLFHFDIYSIIKPWCQAWSKYTNLVLKAMYKCPSCGSEGEESK